MTPRRERVLVERRDLVVRAAELEGAAALEALRLQVDARAGSLVERSRREDRRAVGDAGEPLRRALDVLELDHRHGVRAAAEEAESPERPGVEEVRGAGPERVARRAPS